MEEPLLATLEQPVVDPAPAVARARPRWPGILSFVLVLGLIANPHLLTNALDLIGGLWA